MGRAAHLNRKKTAYVTIAAWPPFLESGRAGCAGADPELFVTEDDRGRKRVERIAEARTYCTPCPLRAACEAWATETGQTGVWGGTTTEQRRVRLARSRRYARA